MTACPLRIDRLSHAYGATPVLHDVSFDVQPGEVVALLGPSGVGKTTLLRAIAGLMVPDAGALWLHGERVVDDGRITVPAERRRVGLVFQDYALFPHLDVAANIAFGMPRPIDAQKVQQLLDLTDLSGLGTRPPHALSGGQQQRVAVARALAADPALLLLDEPFANVDPALRLELGERLHRIVAGSGKAALLITHDRDEALGLADRVVVLTPSERGGVVAQVDRAETVYRQPASGVVAGLTGPTALVRGRRERSTLHTKVGPWTLDEQAPTTATAAVVRPESFTLVDGDFPVRRVRWAPPGWLVQVDTPAGVWWVATDARPPGPTVGLRPRGPFWAVEAE